MPPYVAREWRGTQEILRGTEVHVNSPLLVHASAKYGTCADLLSTIVLQALWSERYRPLNHNV